MSFETTCRQLIAAGRKIFPIHYRSKAPMYMGWYKCKNKSDDKILEDMLNAELQEAKANKSLNTGICAGAVSGMLTVDCDFKHASAEEFWEQWKPHLTKGVLVRTSKGYHCHFNHPGKHVQSQISGLCNGIDLLSDTSEGSEPRYIIAPGSVHPCGATYEYVDDDPMALTLADPLPEVPKELMDLIDDPLLWTGDGGRTSQPKSKSKRDMAEYYANNPGAMFDVDPFDDEPIGEGMRNNELTRIAGKFLYMYQGNEDFTEEDLISELLTVNTKRCQPPLEEAEVEHLCRSIFSCRDRKEDTNRANVDAQGNYKFSLSSAEKETKAAGTAFTTPEALATPDTEKPDMTTKTVGRCSIWILHNSIFRPCVKGGDFSLVFTGGEFYLYSDNVWRRVEEQFIQSVIQAKYMDATRGNVSGVLEFLKNVLYYPVRNFPFWKGASPPGYPKDCRKVIPFKNGLFDVEHYVNTGDLASSLKPHHHGLFNTMKLEYDFDPGATCDRWKAFLASIWGSENSDRAEALREWAGHTMIPDTTQHKICLLHGVPRSGKSTIGRLLFDLIGKENAVSTDLHTLANEHGPSALVGKNLAVLFDAHLPSSASGDRSLEKLKGISGGDPQIINPKFLAPYTTILNARLMIICNEVPRLKDSGNALLARMIPFRCDKSFVDRENIHLQSELSEELPGIAVWALEGVKRYISKGYLMRPKEAIEDLQNIKRVLNPISAFGDDCLSYTCDPKDKVSMDDLYRTWIAWCELNHIYSTGTKDRFFSQLRATCPPIAQMRVNGVMHWTGMKLIQTVTDLNAANQF